MTKTALVTGAAKRLGATIATQLHLLGYNIVIHYNQAAEAAKRLSDQFNATRAHSAITLQADLEHHHTLQPLVTDAVAAWGNLDVLINNAAAFYPTAISKVTEKAWQTIFAVNAKAPFFLSQAAIPHLRARQGNIINIVDIHAEQPIKQFSIYCMSKAAQLTMTRAMAKELGPAIRINGIAPGMVVWPDDDSLTASARESIIKRIALKRGGNPNNIAQTVKFILENDYLTGEIIHVDGGRLLHV